MEPANESRPGAAGRPIIPASLTAAIIILAVLLIFAAAVLLAIQAGGPGGETLGPARNLTSEDYAPFLNAGCVYGREGGIDCEAAQFRQEFKCFSPQLQISGEGLLLEPSAVLAWCPVEVYRNRLGEQDMRGYFYCGGGLLRTCASYVYWNGTSFVQIRNESGLASLAAPITSGSEAIAFVLISQDVSGRVERDGTASLLATAQKNGTGYTVTAYHYDMFGCYDKLDYEAVTYSVSPEGAVKELGRKVAYTRHLGHMLCVD
jgi:hypothetical protein